jgi:methylthioribulose-1-phosphate dehydratase
MRDIVYLSELQSILMEDLKQQLVEISRMCYTRGWALATSGNFSMRVANNQFLITASAKDKGKLEAEDTVLVDLDGRVQDGSKPSAETTLHCQLYRTSSEIGSVLHTHSVYSTIFSLQTGDQLTVENYEMLKALRGVTTHEYREVIPIFANNQDMTPLAAQMVGYLQQSPACHAMLIRGHGLYTWGRDLAEAKKHLEALEFILECEYRRSKL